MAEYIVLTAAVHLLPGFHFTFKRVRGKFQLVELRVSWPWWSWKQHQHKG
jgi:hypothetical protein